MRVLEFVVDGQLLRKKSDCDFSHIVAGSVGYLKAVFHFSSEWAGCRKAASFWLDDAEYAVLLDESNSCVIPEVILTGEKFHVSVVGAKSGYKITTNKIKVKQEVR